tara:strand:- start:107 stop:721 length:615 start_codon:yes stop_codon:yes gene_type:complete
MNKTFKELPADIAIFKNLPTDLHHCIFSYMKPSVYNNLWFDLPWLDIIRFLGERYSFEELFDICNKNIPNECKLEIDDNAKHRIGMYLEKVKPFSMWGKRYIYFEDCIDEELAIDLLLDTIDSFINNENYTDEIMFTINCKYLSMYKYYNEIISFEEEEDRLKNTHLENIRLQENIYNHFTEKFQQDIIKNPSIDHFSISNENS